MSRTQSSAAGSDSVPAHSGMMLQHGDLFVDMETIFLKNQITVSQSRIHFFEKRHGKFSSQGLHGNVDDMELVEWEGEIATLERLQKKLTQLNRA